MKNESDDAGSETPQLSSEISFSDSKKKYPCEICGSDANDHLITTCLKCTDTREHIYCMRVKLPSVPPMWLCEGCRWGSRIVVIDSDTANSITTSDSSCTSHQPSQAHTSVTVEEASSPVSMDESSVKKQNLPDLNLPYDGESAE